MLDTHPTPELPTLPKNPSKMPACESKVTRPHAVLAHDAVLRVDVRLIRGVFQAGSAGCSHRVAVTIAPNGAVLKRRAELVDAVPQRTARDATQDEEARIRPVHLMERFGVEQASC